ncbi:MAG: alkaline phosphatase family protein [Planctomycetota bacterium]
MDVGPGVLSANGRRVLLIGWDAADWQVARPLMDAGKMPSLKRLVDSGVSGNLATIRPVLSPMLWTSIATGKRPFKHGVHGFTEPSPDGSGVRPVTNLSRTSKAIWNMLMHAGKRSVVVGWWPSHPAEPIDGVMVSNFYQHASAPVDRPWGMPAGTVWPESYRDRLKEFRFHPGELTAAHLAPLIPKIAELDPAEDERVGMCAKIVSEVTSVHAAATALMQLEHWDLMAVYYDGIDHFGHGFMKYHPPQQEHVSDEDFETYRHVVEASYRWHDQILGSLLALAGDDVTVVLISDHGFHSDHLRPRQLPAEPAGPAAEHSPYGIFVARGEGIARGQRVYGASVLDVCPTLLTLFGLPVGEDMDGTPIVTAFEEPPADVERIGSWEDVAGACGTHDPERLIDPTESAEMMRQLVELGYIEEPDADAALAREECVRELRYNLAVSLTDAGQYGEASKLLDSLWEAWPTEHRFGIALIDCYGALGLWDERRGSIERLEDRMRSAAVDARRELAELKPELERYRLDAEGVGDRAGERTGRDGEPLPGDRPPRRLMLRARRLAALTSPRPALVQWLRVTQAVEEGEPEEALSLLERLRATESEHPAFHLQLGHAYRRLLRHEEAGAAYERVLTLDPHNAPAFLGLAMVRLGTGRAGEAVEAALSATELRFHLPRAHYILGRALAELGETEHARRAFGVAITQAPGFREAHRALAELLEASPDESKQAEARRHRELARDVHREQVWRRAWQRVDASEDTATGRAWFAPTRGDQAGWVERDPSGVVTVVSGLPRTGTSMMMQMLAAGGLRPVTDERRLADESNPRGYFEDDRAARLARDSSWITEARGRVVKVVAPLLSLLPETEFYQIIFLERDAEEVVASQRTMLDRLGKTGAALTGTSLREALARQLESARAFMDGSDHVRVRFLRYEDVVTDPSGAVDELAAFIGTRLWDPTTGRSAAVARVDASLHRQRRGGTVAENSSAAPD